MFSNQTPRVIIQGREIGEGHPCFIIAEAGVNHNGSLETAIEMIDVAAQAGVDAVKFQTFDSELLVTASAQKAQYQTAATGDGQTQQQMLKQLELRPSEYLHLKGYCENKGLVFLSTPFEEKSAGFLFNLGVPAFKIPSGEITNLAFLDAVARYGLPIILSTGMANIAEVHQAVRTIFARGNRQLILLQCVSNYPSDPAASNLRSMETMRQAFGLVVGYSDHTLGLEVALGAVALGARVIEKHFTLSKSMYGPDHQASLEPKDLGELVKQIRNVESALGNGIKEPSQSEWDTARVARKSIVASTHIPLGSIIDAQMLCCKRPGTGLEPSMLPSLLGKRSAREIYKDELLTLEDLA